MGWRVVSLLVRQGVVDDPTAVIILGELVADTTDSQSGVIEGSTSTY